MAKRWTNKLFFGDNLDVLRKHVPDESIDLVYLDPPFNSDADYNVLFKERSGKKSTAQIRAFEDTWHWGQEAEAAYVDVVHKGGALAALLPALRQFLGASDMMAYVTMMAPRLAALHQVLKPTGSLYLHCDSTASHYLKLVLDAVFGPERFLNEVIWKRTHSHGNVNRNFGSIYDNILVYTKADSYTWNKQHTPFSLEYIEEKFRYRDKDGRRWQSVTLRNPGVRPNLHYPYPASNGVTYQPHPNGWSCDPDRMRKYDRETRLHFPTKPGGQLRLKMYLDEMPGIQLQNLWDDIYPINSQAKERLGYPTQKPEALLERIIKASSNEGDAVLDPFCGCGTAVAVAERLHRRWVGIDLTHLAITLIRHRLDDHFGRDLAPYSVEGVPTDTAGAGLLAEQDKHQFELWACGLVEAFPTHEKKKGADAGIDGLISFFDDGSGIPKRIVVQVKGGGTGARDVRDLKGVLDREKAPIGVLITLSEPTAAMRKEAATAGFYQPEHFPGKRFPRIQLLSIEDVLERRKRIEYLRIERNDTTFMAAEPKAKGKKGKMDGLFE